MNTRLRKLLDQRVSREEGMTLVEVVVTILIIGVLAAIAVPIFSNYQNELASTQVKSELQSAAILIEQEAIDNNGLFPQYLPNEVLEQDAQYNPDANPPVDSKYIYTYSPDRTHWCIQVASPSGKLFISDSNKSPSHDVCTQENVGAGSGTPWKKPTIPTVSITNAANSWASNSTTAVASLTWGAVECPLSSEDQEEWGTKAVVSYSVQILNSTRANPVIADSNWQAGTSATIPLNGWLPSDNITYKVRARCTITSGVDYNYYGQFSSPRPDVVATFVVNPVSFTSTPALTWGATDTAASFTANWVDGFCPSGTKQYILTASSATGNFSTGYTSWTTATSRTLPTTFTGGQQITFNHVVSCLLTDGRRINSAATVAIANVPLRPPGAPATISSNNAQGLTTVIPNNVLWSAVTCLVGTPQYNLQRISPSATSSGWIVATNQNQTHTAGTVYSWQVQARCVSGSQTSAAGALSTTLTYTAQYSIPTQPAVPTNLRSDGNGGTLYSIDRLLWNAVSCDAGATPEYAIRQVTKDGVAVPITTDTAWQTATSLILSSGWNGHGSTQGYQVKARCTNAAGSSPITAYSATHTFTPTVPAPSAAPAGLANNGASTFTWGAVTCASGTTAQYYTFQTRVRDTYGTWIDEDWNSVDRSSVIPQYAQGIPVHANVKARCAGPNAFSLETADTVIGWVTGLSGPSWTAQIHYGSCPPRNCGAGSNNVDSTGISCPAGAGGTSPRIRAVKNTSNYYGAYAAWEAYGSGSWGSGAWGANWGAAAHVYCSTSWKSTGAYRNEGPYIPWGAW